MVTAPAFTALLTFGVWGGLPAKRQAIDLELIRELDHKDRGRFALLLAVRIVQLSRDKNKFARRESDIATPKLSTKTANNCELPERCDLAWFVEIPFLDLEQFVPDE